MVQEGEEVYDSDGYEDEKPSNVITLEDILGADQPTADAEDLQQDQYHSEFIR